MENIIFQTATTAGTLVAEHLDIIIVSLLFSVKSSSTVVKNKEN